MSEAHDRRLIDAVKLNQIVVAYHGNMDTLDFNDPTTRAQLAFDLGYLIGLCQRLLHGDQDPADP